MKKNLLHDLYDAKIYPIEQFCPNTEEYRKLCHCQDAHHKNISQALTTPLQGELEEYIENLYRISSIESSEMFVNAFRLGAKMMLEILQDE